jgi:hypothetical protein
MLRQLLVWLSGWATTLRIMIFERDTYRYLTGDLEEVEIHEPHLTCYLSPSAGSFDRQSDEILERTRGLDSDDFRGSHE